MEDNKHTLSLETTKVEDDKHSLIVKTAKAEEQAVINGWINDPDISDQSLSLCLQSILFLRDVENRPYFTEMFKTLEHPNAGESVHLVYNNVVRKHKSTFKAANQVNWFLQNGIPVNRKYIESAYYTVYQHDENPEQLLYAVSASIIQRDNSLTEEIFNLLEGLEKHQLVKHYDVLNFFINNAVIHADWTPFDPEVIDYTIKLLDICHRTPLTMQDNELTTKFLKLIFGEGISKEYMLTILYPSN